MKINDLALRMHTSCTASAHPRGRGAVPPIDFSLCHALHSKISQQNLKTLSRLRYN